MRSINFDYLRNLSYNLVECAINLEKCLCIKVSESVIFKYYNLITGNLTYVYFILVKVKWGKETYPDIELNTEEPPMLFKAQLFALTGVQPERQKVMLKGVTLKDSDWNNFKLKDVCRCYNFVNNLFIQICLRASQYC